jgi:hypothetical protein
MINISKVKVKEPRTLPTYGSGELHNEQQFCYELGYREGITATRKAIREAIDKEESIKINNLNELLKNL